VEEKEFRTSVREGEGAWIGGKRFLDLRRPTFPQEKGRKKSASTFRNTVGGAGMKSGGVFWDLICGGEKGSD